MKVQEVIPYVKHTDAKKGQIQLMFDRIALRYDFLNHLLSFQLDRYWRRKAISSLKGKEIKSILDVASGTGDLAIQAAKLNPEIIIAGDISSNMLQIAKNKIQARSLDHLITCCQADGEDLIFPDGSFDAVTIAFGIRNFGNINQGLKEFHRVLSQNGSLVILEFSLPKMRLIKAIYLFYFRRILPAIGRLISRDKEAYNYLNKSVEAFPPRHEMLQWISEAGFKEVACEPVTLGLVSLYKATKHR